MSTLAYHPNLRGAGTGRFRAPVMTPSLAASFKRAKISGAQSRKRGELQKLTRPQHTHVSWVPWRHRHQTRWVSHRLFPTPESQTLPRSSSYPRLFPPIHTSAWKSAPLLTPVPVHLHLLLPYPQRPHWQSPGFQDSKRPCLHPHRPTRDQQDPHSPCALIRTGTRHYHAAWARSCTNCVHSAQDAP